MYSSWARCRVWTKVLAEIGEGSRARKKIYHKGHGDRSTERTESYGAALQSAAVAAGGKGKGTQRGTVLGAIGGHGSLQKKDSILGFFVEPRGGEAHFRTTRVYQNDDYRVNKNSVVSDSGANSTLCGFWQRVRFTRVPTPQAHLHAATHPLGHLAVFSIP
jgi:hypothetical protein